MARGRTLAVRRAGFGLWLLLGLVGCGDGLRTGPAQETAATTMAAPAFDAGRSAAKAHGASYDGELALLSAAIDGSLKLINAQPDNGALLLEAVSLYIERARLTGGYADYRSAERLLADTAAGMAKSAYPCLAHAKLHYAVHRLQAAAAALDACPVSAATDEVVAMRGDIAFYSGRYREADDIYRRLVNQIGTPQHYARLALVRNRLGSPGEAAAFLEAAEKRYFGASANMKAWLKMQRGLLAFDRGRLDEAIALYRLAADEMPGWWLVDEQIAEALRLAGDLAGARRLLEGLVQKTGLAEHMDELARVLREGEQPDEANAWIARAAAQYRERLQVLPEASAGHAVNHFLQFGAPAEALALAERSARLRPFGEAQIALAAAQFRSGLASQAAAGIEKVQASGWSTPQLHAMAATVFAGAGRVGDADAARSRALAMNRHAMRLFQLPQPAQPAIVSML